MAFSVVISTSQLIFGLMQVSFKKLSILQMMHDDEEPTEGGSDDDEEF